MMVLLMLTIRLMVMNDDADKHENDDQDDDFHDDGDEYYR